MWQNFCGETSWKISMCKTSNIMVDLKEIDCEDDGTGSGLWPMADFVLQLFILHILLPHCYLPVQCDISPVYFLPIAELKTPCSFRSILFIKCNKNRFVSSINVLKIIRYIWKLRSYNWIIPLLSSQVPSDHGVTYYCLYSVLFLSLHNRTPSVTNKTWNQLQKHAVDKSVLLSRS
jgi:hypothetical protein